MSPADTLLPSQIPIRKSMVEGREDIVPTGGKTVGERPEEMA
jgi:hypothetical protein